MKLDTTGLRYLASDGKIYTIPENYKLWQEYLVSVQYAGHEGIMAIKFLQSLPGIRESTVDALRGWKSMTSSEQAWTIALARRLGLDV
jgi:hypothetical protein